VKRGLAASVASVALLGACAIGPDYSRPGTPETTSYYPQPSASPESIADLPWWSLFQDPVLVSLVEEAIRENHDLRAATARVEQARAIAGVTRSPLFPQLGYDAAAARGRASVFTTPIPGASQTQSFFLGALNATWELDIWGRIRRETESAVEQLLATEAFRRAVLLSVVTDVATAYLQLRELDLELEITRRNMLSFEETSTLFRRRFERGVASKLEVTRAQAALYDATAREPQIERDIVAVENVLAVLLGRPPGPIPRGAALLEQRYPPEVPEGLPSQLLERRPDILQAEHELAAANALIGAALADFFPRLGLTALYGKESTALGDIVSAGAGIWSVGATLSGPLFRGGQVWYTYQLRKDQLVEQIARYERSVLDGFRDVSNALTARDQLARAQAEQAKAVFALTESVRLARIRYDGGLSSYFEVLDAQQQLFPAELRLAQLELGRQAAIVALYRALGGGWNLADAQWQPAPGAAPTQPAPGAPAPATPPAP